MTRVWALLLLTCAGCGEDDPSFASREELLDPRTCARCHEDHFREWSGSMHAYAAADPLFLAMNARGQRETNGELGSFCVGCHAPMAVREGLTTDGLNLDEVPDELEGVTCFFCHTVDAVEGAHNNPLRLARGITMRGPFADPVDNEAHPSAYSALHDRDKAESASLCGSCHDIVTPLGAAIERTYVEWQASVFAEPGGATCGQCHMDQSTHLEPVAKAPGVLARRRHAHGFPGVDVALTEFPEADAQRAAVEAFLGTTLQSALCVVQSGVDQSAIRVILDNVAGGHGFPSGAGQDRRLWVEIVATRGEEVLYQSGLVPDGTPVTEVEDPDLWLMRDCMLGEDGEEVHMFWEAFSAETNQLPAQATFNPLDPRFYQTHVLQSFPRGALATFAGVPDRVTLKVRLQPVGLEVLDDLVESGDLDPAVRDAMPTFDLAMGGETVLEWTSDAVNGQYFEDGLFPVQCVTHTNLNVVADKVPAAERASCAP